MNIEEIRASVAAIDTSGPSEAKWWRTYYIGPLLDALTQTETERDAWGLALLHDKSMQDALLARLAGAEKL